MRATENSAKGSSGQSFVKGQFEELDWGVVQNLEHDLGTDLFLMARDARRFDIGALVGAQVKNWAYEFDKPEVVEGVEGWWFADTAEHFDYWLEHRVPHIVVLYDKWARVSHWVHVTPKATVSTGKGRKIFVPQAQTVDAEHFDDLIRVAISKSIGQSWEGSAWLPGQQIPEVARWRYAMLVPRLIAPHGNSTVEDVTASQAIALLAAYRVWEVSDHLREVQPLLAEAASLGAEDSSWKLYGAFHAWVVRGDMEPLQTSLPGLPAEVRAAHTAMRAAALFEAGDVQQATAIVEAALSEYDNYNPVDYAWLTLHRARNLAQLGRVSEAKALALEVVPIGQVAPSDPTARFLTGVASDMVFSLSDWRAGDLAATIQARDNAASWWRSQTMTAGLANHFERSFENWAHDTSITYRAFDETWAKLRSATLISGFGADTANWRYEVSLLAQYMLMREEDATQVAAALSLLRLSGSTKQLKLAVEYLLDSGPVEGIEEALQEIDLGLSTRDSLQSDLELVGLAAYLLPEEVSDKIMGWLLGEVADPASRANALSLRFLYPELLWGTVARLYIACSHKTQETVRRTVAKLPMVTDQSIAHAITRLFSNIGAEQWSPEDVSALASRPEGDNFEFSQAAERVVARRDSEYRQGLLSRISDGEVQALSAWGDVTELPEEAARGMIASSVTAARAESEASKGGVLAVGGPSAFARLVLLNCWHSSIADWTPVVEALEAERTNPDDILPGLEVMASQADSIPQHVRDGIRGALRRLSTAAPPDEMFGGFRKGHPRGLATELLAVFFPEDVGEAHLLELLRGSDNDVRTAVRVFAVREDISSLALFASLAGHKNTEVRAAVAGALSRWTAKGIGGEQVQMVLRRLLDEPGVKLATHVTRAIVQEPRTEGAEVVLGLLDNHSSALVRLQVRIIRNRWKGADV